jgi:hypothetical protein
LLAVPQGARPGKAGERWWECGAAELDAVVVTVSGAVVGRLGCERLCTSVTLGYV